ncbi:MAG: response regulator [Bacteroidales bacterium]|nr:response regulator [Bacteroidales bacterium]MBN2750006.1 response regulator [Bacteroidales bacterium]
MRKILIIEDDADLRETISEFLQTENFLPLQASSGPEGIQLAILNNPDAIVCDITLPGADGYEVFNMLRQIGTTATIPFIFLTARSTKEDILYGINLGADDYIVKPFQMIDLVKTINVRISKRERIVSESDERFRTLFQNSTTGAVILNGLNVEFVNDYFLSALGYTKGELSGTSIVNITHKDDIMHFTEAVNQCFGKTGTCLSTRFKMVKRDKNVVEVDVRGVSMHYMGTPRLVANFSPVSNGSKLDSTDLHAMVDCTDVKLSLREVEVLKLVCKGLSNSEIADALFLSERTVEGHRSRLFQKTDAKNAVALAMWAVKKGLVEL